MVEYNVFLIVYGCTMGAMGSLLTRMMGYRLRDNILHHFGSGKTNRYVHHFPSISTATQQFWVSSQAVGCSLPWKQPRRVARPRARAQVNSSQRLTFLAIGVTGTGKSELCKWLTGTKGCVSSDSMESNTSHWDEMMAENEDRWFLCCVF